MTRIILNLDFLTFFDKRVKKSKLRIIRVIDFLSVLDRSKIIETLRLFGEK